MPENSGISRDSASSSSSSSSSERDHKLITAVAAAKHEADNSARHSRLAQNARNWQCYPALADHSGKIAGQSTEYLPKVSVALDKWTAKVRQALVSGDFVKLRFKPGRQAAALLPESDATAWLRFQLENLAGPEGHIATIVADALKLAALDSSCAIKVTDGRVKVPQGPVPGKAGKSDFWRLRLELVPFARLWRDPLGTDSYVAAHEVRRRAQDGWYDRAAVAKLTQLSFDEGKPAAERGEEGAQPQAGRRRAPRWPVGHRQRPGDSLARREPVLARSYPICVSSNPAESPRAASTEGCSTMPLP